MVQNINNQTANPYGTIKRVGMTQNERIVYQMLDGTGKEVGKLSIPQKDCDVFEKSYHDIIDAAPKVQNFAEKHQTPESIKKLKSTSNWIIGGSAAVGSAIGIFTTSKLTTFKQILSAVGGLIAGSIGGIALSGALLAPPGMKQLNKATQTISKIDIQPVIE